MIKFIDRKLLKNLDYILEILLYIFIFVIPISIGAINTIAGILFLILLVRLILKRDYIIFEGTLNKAIILFLLLILISAFFAGKDYGRTLYGFMSPVLKYVVMYYLVINLINKKSSFNKAIKLYWVATAIGAIYASYSHFIGGVTRAEGFTHNPNRLGSMMMIFIIFNFSMLLFDKNKRVRLLATIGIVLGFLGLFSTLSRSALFSTLIGLAIVSLLKDKRLIIVFLMASLLLFMILPGDYINRLELLKNIESNNVSQRLLMYRMGLKLFQRYPFTGIGFKAVGGIYDRFELVEFNELRNTYNHLHNVFINIAVEMGIFGLMVFLFLLFRIIKKAWKLFKETNHGFIAGILGIISGQIFQNTVDINLHGTEVGLVFVFFIGLLVVFKKNATKLMDDGIYGSTLANKII